MVLQNQDIAHKIAFAHAFEERAHEFGAVNQTQNELITFNNIVNELCNGIALSDADLQSRAGASRMEVFVLLQQIQDAIDSLETHEKHKSKAA